MILGQHIIREASRSWTDHKVFPGLLDFLNITLPCGQTCPVGMATARSCNLSSDRENLHIEMDVPVVNTDVQFVEADAFELFV